MGGFYSCLCLYAAWIRNKKYTYTCLLGPIHLEVVTNLTEESFVLALEGLEVSTKIDDI